MHWVTVWSADIKASRGLEEGPGVLVMPDQVARNVYCLQKKLWEPQRAKKVLTVWDYLHF